MLGYSVKVKAVIKFLILSLQISASEVKLGPTEQQYDARLGRIEKELVEIKQVLIELKPQHVATPAGPVPPPKPTTLDDEVMDALENHKSNIDGVRSIQALDGFTYDANLGQLACDICAESTDSKDPKQVTGCFNYSADLGTDFSESRNMPESFRKLKSHLKDHIDSTSHRNSVHRSVQTEKSTQHLMSRSLRVGLAVARTAYIVYRNAFGMAKFEDLISLQNLNGQDMGQLNHSKRFATEFRNSVAAVIKLRAVQFLSTPLEQTGHRPAVNLCADKGTYKHRTRQLTALLLIAPDSPDLIELMYVGHPIVTAHDGHSLASLLKHSLDDYKVRGSQIVGASFDGQYIHLNVEESLKSQYEQEGSSFPCNIVHDPMHRAGLCDRHLNDKGQFKWLTDLVNLCQDLYNRYNWGQSHEAYLQASDELDVHANLVRFSETRFANSKRFVFSRVFQAFATIIKCLTESQVQQVHGRAAKDKQMNDELLMRRLLNAATILKLAATSDVYNQFGRLVNICQIVNLLPHERLDKVEDVLLHMGKMTASCTAHERCPRDDCHWPNYHAAKETYLQNQTIKGVPIPDFVARKVNRTRGDQGSAVAGPNTAQEVTEDVERSIMTFSESLTASLKEGQWAVFHHEDKALIRLTETITDLHGLKTFIEEEESPLTAAAKRWQGYRQAIRKVVGLAEISDEVLRSEFTQFCSILSGIPSTDGMSSKGLIQAFVSSKNDLHQGCEMIVYATTVASLKFGVESTVESAISIFEGRLPKTRNVREEVAEEDMQIALNGPTLNNSNAILTEALNKHFHKPGQSSSASSWHFTTNTPLLTKSVVLQRKQREKSKFPFMD